MSDTQSTIDMRPCKGCIYLGWANGVRCCDFLVRVGHSRGCPAGKGCKAKKTRRMLELEEESLDR